VEELPVARRIWVRIVRLLYATLRGFGDQNLKFQAAALTYFTALSVVPFLAFAFSALKGFGVYYRLVHQTIEPYLKETFGSSPTLLSAVEQVLRFVEHTQVSSLGTFGVLFLLYSSIAMLSTVEKALNGIWRAKSPRPLIRRVTDYTTILVVTPLLAFAAVTFATAAQSSGVVHFLRDTVGLGPLIHLGLKVTSLLLGCTAMIALYLLMPNTRVRVTSAVIGGLVGGCLWQLALFLYVDLQSGVAQYNALYAGFAALPIFLVWLYASWMTVLVGGLVAATHQHERNVRYAMRTGSLDESAKELLAVAIAVEVGSGFRVGAPAPTDESLAQTLSAPTPAVEEAVLPLIRGGVLTRVVSGGEQGYAPARDLEAIQLHDIRRAVRCDPGQGDIRRAVERSLSPEVKGVLEEAQRSWMEAEQRISLRELADLARRHHRPAPPPEDRRLDLFDAKQPGLG
jgi:membrane protein